MLKVLLFCWFLKIVCCSCPPDFELVRDGQCRGQRGTKQFLYAEAYNDIVSKCAEIQGLPIIIHNEEDAQYWSNVKEKNGASPDYGWPIGLKCNTTTTDWEWADGSRLDFKPNKHDAALDSSCKTGCVWNTYSDGRFEFHCGSGGWGGQANIYCITQLLQPSPSEDCGRFEQDDEDGLCYEIGKEAESWQDAQLNCRNVGADLASIHNSQENSFVRRLAVSDGAVNGLFLGASLSGKGNSFGWIDGTPWDYQNFYPAFPMDGFGDCLAMDTSISSGQWMNRDCSSKLPVACIRKAYNVTGSSLTCNPGPWQEGGVITSPGYPFNASVPCEFFLSVEKGKLIEAEIISLEANSCCDFLTIHDDYLGGNLIANITGEVRNATYTSTTNFMRVSWQPNGGVNVMGLAMVFHGV